MLYAKTAEGHFAAYNPDSPLPRKLKQVLMAVNGKTDSAMINKMLSAYGDVPSLLSSLEMAGLIVRVADADKRSAISAPERPDLSSVAPSTWRAAANKASSFNAWETTQFAMEPSEIDAQLWGGKAPAELTNAMSDFVLTHLPRHATALLSLIDGIASPQDLQQALVQYEPVALLAGDAGERHLAYVRQWVSETAQQPQAAHYAAR
jgi:hypothetical protein